MNEGELLSVSNLGTFTDPSFAVRKTSPIPLIGETAAPRESGSTVIDTTGQPGTSTQGHFNGQHTYTDNGLYMVTVTLVEDDGGQDTKTFLAFVNNIAPTLSVVSDQTANEGATLVVPNLGTFTDPGFDNPLGDPPISETFTYQVDWMVRTWILERPTFKRTVVQVFLRKVPSTVLIPMPTTACTRSRQSLPMMMEDRMLKHFRLQSITLPRLLRISAIKPRTKVALDYFSLGSFTDPGFDNPLATTPTSETFTYQINWGDGSNSISGNLNSRTSGAPGVLTEGTFFTGGHSYPDGNGIYTVTVTLTDDDGGQDIKTFQFTVSNFAPTLTVHNQHAFSGQLLSLPNRELLPDRGFNNPLGDPTTSETFTYQVDWGDGTEHRFRYSLLSNRWA